MKACSESVRNRLVSAKMHLGVAIAFATCDVIAKTTEMKDNIQQMKHRKHKDET